MKIQKVEHLLARDTFSVDTDDGQYELTIQMNPQTQTEPEISVKQKDGGLVDLQTESEVIHLFMRGAVRGQR
jgi:hypothetical protein